MCVRMCVCTCCFICAIDPSNRRNAVYYARVWLAVCYFPLTSDLYRRPRGREREKQNAAGGDGGHSA